MKTIKNTTSCYKCLKQAGLKFCKRCKIIQPSSYSFYDKRSVCNTCSIKYPYLQETADRKQNTYLLRHYGISLEDYQKLLHNQQGLCKICKQQKQKLSVDHDHKTGKVRGLLCRSCNFAIGALKDSVQATQNATVYLQTTEDDFAEDKPVPIEQTVLITRLNYEILLNKQRCEDLEKENAFLLKTKRKAADALINLNLSKEVFKQLAIILDKDGNFIKGKKNLIKALKMYENKIGDLDLDGIHAASVIDRSYIETEVSSDFATSSQDII